jgi:hypothetical protein
MFAEQSFLGSQRSRVFYHCYDDQTPTGGQKETYQHVDILNGLGIEAYVIHKDREFRLQWFENRTKIISMDGYLALHDPTTDYTVLPEDLGAAIATFPGKKVIFNKNVYLGFSALGLHPHEYPYHRADVVAAFCVSEHNSAYLSFAFPSLPVLVIWGNINPSAFSYIPFCNKEPLIACAAKNLKHVYTLHNMLNARARMGLNRGTQFRWTILRGLNERQMAEVLSTSAALVFLSTSEGLGHLPLEAMYSGCVVFAYDCGPSSYLPAPFRFEYGAITDIARSVEELMRSFPSLDPVRESAIQIGRRIASEMCIEQQTRSVAAAWRRIFGAGYRS